MTGLPRIGIVCEGEISDVPCLDVLLRAEFGGAAEFDICGTSKAVIFSALGPLIDEVNGRGATELIVAWDLLPVGRKMGVSSQVEHEKPCRLEQQEVLLDALAGSGTAYQPDIEMLQTRYGFINPGLDGTSRLHLVCFSCTFDAVLLSDADLLRDLASSELRQAERLPRVSLESERGPSGVLRRYFRRGHNKRLKYFNRAEHNEVIARAYIDGGRLGRLQAHSGYARLRRVIQGIVGGAGN